MTLKTRLTLLYTTLVGSVLLLFGVVVYSFYSVTLIKETDDRLENTFLEILKVTRLNSVGDLEVIALPPLDLTANVYIQAWDREGRLNAYSSNAMRMTTPLDPLGLQAAEPLFRNVTLGNARLRVLSVPLQVGSRPIGILQIAANISVIESARRSLLNVLLITAIVVMSLAGVAAWWTTQQALAPLEEVTNTALRITRADDLSSRIPYHGSSQDEVSQLIQAFNQTLGRLEHLFHTQRQFLTDVGHELRTPLTVIKGNVDLLRRMGCTDEESLSGIESEVDRLTRLVGDLLLLAQAEARKLPLDRRPVELDTLLLEVLGQFQVLAKENNIQVHIGEIDQVLVCGDRDRLKQVLLNILGNGLKYTPQGGKITLSLGKTDKMARLTITDTGPGIPPDDLPHIFERFYRAEKSRTKRDKEGFGLGLSIANWIVKGHGGRIEVDSRLGVGTTFCIWLPLMGDDC